MVYKIAAERFEMKVEITGYGIFTLHRLGAAKEAEFQDMLAQAQKDAKSVVTDYKDIFELETNYEKEKDDAKLKELKASKRYQEAREAQNAADDQLNDVKRYVEKCYLELWSAEDQSALEKLFNDFTSEQIRSFYAQAMKNGGEH